MFDGRMFRFEFLDIVFTKIAEPRVIGLDYGFGREALGDGDQGDFAARPAAGLDSASDAFLDLS